MSQSLKPISNQVVMRITPGFWPRKARPSLAREGQKLEMFSRDMIITL